jgi:hypothetical protein
MVPEPMDQAAPRGSRHHGFFDRQNDRARLRPQRAQTRRPTLLGSVEGLVIG